jgi:hypothetical protein
MVQILDASGSNLMVNGVITHVKIKGYCKSESF